MLGIGEKPKYWVNRKKNLFENLRKNAIGFVLLTIFTFFLWFFSPLLAIFILFGAGAVIFNIIMDLILLAEAKAHINNDKHT